LFFAKKILVLVGSSFCCFRAIFEGVFEKLRVLAWCFDGEIVVDGW